MAEYEIWLTNDRGTRLALLDDCETLEYVLNAGDVGGCAVTIPGDRERSLFVADRKIEIWRKPSGGRLTMERAYLLRGITRQTDENGVKRYVLEGVDGNDLLRRRIVAYSVGSTEARKMAAADDMIKALARENMSTAATSTDRAYNANYFTVEANASLGPSIVKAFSRRDVLGVCQELSEASGQSTGPQTYFDVMSPTPATYELRTYVDQIGVDHRFPSGINPVLIGLEYGNLNQPEIVEDYSREVNVVYSGGQNEAADRVIYEAEDTARSYRSIWARSESFANAIANEDTTGVQDEAFSALAAGKPTLRFRGQIVDSPGTIYGIHWRWGDRVTAIYGGQSWDATVNQVRVRHDGEREEIESQVECTE